MWSSIETTGGDSQELANGEMVARLGGNTVKRYTDVKVAIETLIGYSEAL